FGVHLELALLEDFGQVRGHALADAGDFEQLFLVADQLRDGLRQALDGFGGTAVGTDPEGGLALGFHPVGGLVEDGGDALVVEGPHGSSLDSIVLASAVRGRGPERTKATRPESYHRGWPRALPCGRHRLEGQGAR